MSNRARPTWSDGSVDSAKSAESPAANGQSAPQGSPAANGRTTPAADASPRPAQTSNRQPRPAPTQSQPPRAPQQPQVRPAVKQSPSAPSGPPRLGATPPAAAKRPESRQPSQTPANPPPAASTYGQVGGSAPSSAPAPSSASATAAASAGSAAGTIGARVTSAKQAVLDKATAVKEAAAQSPAAKPRERDAQAGAATKATTRHQTRKARLRLSKLDPWSVMKTAFLLSIAFGIVTWVAVFLVWSAIGAAGVFDNINNTVSEVLGSPAAEPFRIENYINTGKVMGFTTLLACADVLIITALATLGSFLYNISATLLGGLEVTLASED